MTQFGKDKQSKIIGALGGAALGGVIGHNIDKRRCELYKVAQANQLKMASKFITAKSLGIQSDATVATKSDPNVKAESDSLGVNVMVKEDGRQFNEGSATLTPAGNKAFTDMARVYASADSTHSGKILIVAHGDEGSSSEDSVKLSEERAKAVAKVFAQNGVNAKDIYYQGAGDSLPVSNNATAAGQADNRRIQIVDLPSTADLEKYLQLRSADPRNFKIASSTNKPANPVASSTSKGDVPQTASVKQPKAPAVARRSSARNYDFGGMPYASDTVTDLGASLDASAFSFISSANATSTVKVGSCLNDKPHQAGSVRNLQTNDALDLKIKDAIAGLHGAPIMGTANGHFVLIEDAYVSKDSGIESPEPKVQIFRDYSTKHGKQPDYKETVPVNVYRGKKAILYRMFVNGPMQCMDLVVDPGNPKVDANILYTLNNEEFLAQSPLMVKAVKF